MTKGLNNILYLLFLQCAVQRWRVEVETCTRTHRQALAGIEVGHIAAVTKLDAGFRALCVNTVGEALQILFDLIVDIELTVKRHTRTGHRAVCHCGHRCTTTSNGCVVVVEVLTWFVTVCHILKSGTTDSAVAQSNWTEFMLSKKEIIVHC